MRKPVIFITGANGEIGHGLITQLTGSGGRQIVTLDLAPLDPDLRPLVQREFIGSILDAGLLERILSEFEVDLVFHLAALLSTRSEFTPIRAHEVNVQGTLVLLEFAQKEAESHGRPVTFLYPSSIAAYGMPDLATKRRAGKVSEDESTTDNDVRREQALLRDARQLLRAPLQAARGRNAERQGRLPLRALPGPHLRDDGAVWRHLRLRARDDPRGCARRQLSLLRAPGHPDPVHGDARWRRGAAQAGRAPKAALTRTAYNVAAFNPSAEEIRDIVAREFSQAAITFEVDDKRQGIVDSWPADVDDSAARRDWGFLPEHDLERGFSEYLIPTIRRHYQ